MPGFQSRTFYSSDTEHLQYEGDWQMPRDESSTEKSSNVGPLLAEGLAAVAVAAAALFLGAIILAAWIRIRRKYRLAVKSDKSGGIAIPPSPNPVHILPSSIQGHNAPSPPPSSRSDKSTQSQERTRRIVKNRPQSMVVTPYIATPTYLPQAYIQAQRALVESQSQPGPGPSRFISVKESDRGPVLLDGSGNLRPPNSTDLGQGVYIAPGTVSGPPRKGEVQMTH